MGAERTLATWNRAGHLRARFGDHGRWQNDCPGRNGLARALSCQSRKARGTRTLSGSAIEVSLLGCSYPLGQTCLPAIGKQAALFRVRPALKLLSVCAEPFQMQLKAVRFLM